MFLSTYDKPLDAKRRFVVPQDFRSAEDGSVDGVFCFPSMTAPCIECGGQMLVQQYRRLIEDLPFTHPLRTAVAHQVFSRGRSLAYDTAGRITLPDALCQAFDLTDQVVVVGLMDRFQIWNPVAYQAWSDDQARLAADGLVELAERQHAQALGARP